MSDSLSPKRIVILGAGFGGVYTYRHLERLFRKDPNIHLTVINRNNYFLFTPLLHEVATGGIAPQNIIQPLRNVVKGCSNDLLVGHVRSLSLKNQSVETNYGTISYDYLVLALGSQTHFYGTPGAELYSFTLKTIQDAIRLKQQCIQAFERASRTTDKEERRRLLRFVIIGGGPTGVELAAEISELIYGTLQHYFKRTDLLPEVEILLIQKGPELLPHFSPISRKRALQVLTKKQVQVRFGVSAVSIEPEAVLLDTGERLETATSIWVAGIKPQDVDCDEIIERDVTGRYITDEYGRLKGNQHVFILGDIGAPMDARTTILFPAVAQAATQSSKYIADNIYASIQNHPLKRLTYRSKGQLASLGHRTAVADIGPLHLRGSFAWWLWRTIYLTKFLSKKKKIEIALDWTLNLFAPRDISCINFIDE